MFKRIDKVPELPITNSERLTANAWKVVSDTVITYQCHLSPDKDGVLSRDRDENGNLLTKVIDTRINDMKNAQLRFYKEGDFIMKDANGQTIGFCQWEIDQDEGRFAYVYLFEVYDKVNDYRRDPEIPGFFDSFIYFPDLPDATNVLFTGEQADYEFDEATSMATWTDFVFHVEAVK